MVFLDQFDRLQDKAYWKSFEPKLNIENSELEANIDYISFTDEVKHEARELLNTEGYYRPRHNFRFETQVMGDLVKKLVAANLLPIFGLVYDEFWIIQARIRDIAEAIFGSEYQLRPCIWIWHLDPNKEEAGWKIHRDGHSHSLNPDASPKVLSLWIPLSEATPLNGCISLVPMDRDNPIDCNFDHTKMDFAPSDIRALPAEAGEFLLWNHWVIHWGGKASKRSPEPRMSLAFELEKAGSNLLDAPMLDPFKLPSYEDRLKIIAYQIRQYMHMYDFSKEMLDFAKEALNGERVLT